MSTSVRLWIGFALLWATALLSACGASATPTQTPWIVVVTNTPSSGGGSVGAGAGFGATPTPVPLPTNTPAPVATATRASTPTAASSLRLATYTGSQAPFSIQYPGDWIVSDQEKDQRLVTMSAPDESAYLLVVYGSAGTLNAEEATKVFLQNFNLPDLKAGNPKQNADGSVSTDLEFSDQTTGKPWQGVMRVVKQGTSSLFYVIIFGAAREKFEPSRTLSATLLNSFQERASIVRTPPPIISLATPTPTPRPPPTPTPVRPTNTPRPPAALFRVDVRPHEGYERWGAPKDGCRSFETGQWDNTRPINRLTMDLVIYNDSTREITPSDITLAVLNTAGSEVLWCVFGENNKPLPSAPPRGSAKYIVTSFVDQNLFLAEARVTIFGATVRRCFAPNTRAEVVACR